MLPLLNNKIKSSGSSGNHTSTAIATQLHGHSNDPVGIVSLGIVIGMAMAHGKDFLNFFFRMGAGRF